MRPRTRSECCHGSGNGEATKTARRYGGTWGLPRPDGLAVSSNLPEKRLYLFDTFEGFPKEDLEAAVDDRFADADFEFVKGQFAGAPTVILKKGYFPETTTGLEDCRFCFVMLDADLYKPTMAGLEFFYPRMVAGGYVFAHDYTSYESNLAVSRAVDQFLSDKPEKVIHLPDEWGSVVFRKT